MGWAEDRQALIAQVLSQQLPAVQERLDKVDPSLTQEEESNRASLFEKAATAVSVNNTYIQRSAPTSAQNTAQIKALSRQMNAIIRLVMKNFDDLSGT